MTVIEAVNIILRAVPEKWPIPLPASGVIVVALTLSINTWVAFDKTKDYVTSNDFVNLEPIQCRGEAFDYIVVGAGAAGMIVATRLANASQDKTVLLLEAGGEPSILNELPSMDFFLLNQPANTWIYHTTPQQFSCGHCDGRRSLFTGGMSLGGSTTTNFMMYVRGNREDYNRWMDDAGGDPQWNYKALLPYFKKSEDYNGVHKYSPDAGIYHGKGGLLNIATYDYQPGLQEFIDAAREKGYKIGDYNGADQEVFSPIDVNTQNGWRESTYRAFYRDTGKAINLCVRKYAFVTKVNFVKSASGKPRAVGVTYRRHKKNTDVWARAEVILSAGTIGSPKLLLLSGVGPAYDLQALNIPLVQDLPVGQNLQDHAYTIVGPFLRTPSLNPNRDVTPQAAVKFLIDGNGALAAPAGLAGVGFFTSPYASPSYPDLQVVQFSVSLYPDLPRDLNRFFGIRESVLDVWFHPYHRLNTDARFLVLWLGRPKSVGNLRLASANPRDTPIINPNYLQHPDDLEALLHGFKKVVDLYENTSSLNTPIFHKPVPNCQNHPFKSDNYYRCVIRHFSGSLYHPVGTCALGKVVDNNLRVKGVDGLRVIDASVMPRTPNGNTQAGTFMLAEKGADLIINEDKRQWSEPALPLIVRDGYKEPHDIFNSIPKKSRIEVPTFMRIPININLDNYLKNIPTSPIIPTTPIPVPQVPVSNQQYSNFNINYNSIVDSPSSIPVASSTSIPETSPSSIPETSPSSIPETSPSSESSTNIPFETHQSVKNQTSNDKNVTSAKPDSKNATIHDNSTNQTISFTPSQMASLRLPLYIYIPLNTTQIFGTNLDAYYAESANQIFRRSSSNAGYYYIPQFSVKPLWNMQKFYF